MTHSPRPAGPAPDVVVRRVWGQAVAFLDRSRAFRWVDLLVLGGLAGAGFGALRVAGEWTGHARAAVTIDLSPWALPRYALFSLSRGLVAYALSLGFTLVYGYWAAKDHAAERVLIPLLDILQSIPILGFMPGLVLALVSLFPASNVGLELAAVLMMFTGQVWNMTFSFYHSLRRIPVDMLEVSQVYRYSWWQRLRWVELPSATLGLVWNSMMSMAGGWFFLMINEAFVLGARDFRLPGIGSYMSVAVARGDGRAMAWAIGTMTLMIVALDQLLWRPVVVWAQKYRVEEGGTREAMTSWFLDWLRRSEILASVAHLARALSARGERAAQARPTAAPARDAVTWGRWIPRVGFLSVLGLLTSGAWSLVHLLHAVTAATWASTVGAALLTLGRVLAATVLSTLWTLPAGIAIGRSPNLSRVLQPVTQVAASFPAPMLFPIVIALLDRAGASLGWGSILLMMLGAQWYILFNVVAGATSIPGDLVEAADEYRIRGWRRMTGVYIPAVFPYLVTGWVTAAGGAWNASIVSEYVTFRGRVLTTTGVGASISLAAERGDLAALAAGVIVMSSIVVLFNRSVWRRCFHLAEERFSLNR